MADYINIRGQNIEVVASDPANPTQGQIWYNSTSNTLKGEGYAAGAWATGTTLPASITEAGGTGTANDGIIFGGFRTGASPPVRNDTSHYDGSTWTSGGNLGTARNSISSANQSPTTAALAFAGEVPGTPGGVNVTEEYNGTSWTGGGSMGTARYAGVGGAGTQTAGLGFGGYNAPLGGLQNATEEYNGTSWSGGGNYPVGANALIGCGTQTAGLGVSSATNEYNGTSWTAGGTPSVSAGYKMCVGTQTAALAAGGFDGSLYATTEIYDGTAWTTNPTGISSARYFAGSAGTQSAAFIAGGTTTPPAGSQSSVEEWTGAGPVTQTITAS
jgi:hypothetical protein